MKSIFIILMMIITSTVYSQVPTISNINFSGSIGQNLQIDVKGSNFGQPPVSMPFTGDINNFGFNDYTNLWEAGYAPDGNSVGLLYSSWTSNEIIITGFGSGYGGRYVVQPGDTVVIHVNVNGYNFTSAKIPLTLGDYAFSYPPAISAFSPSFGSIGTSVTITGINFNPTATDDVVYFGATKATVTNASSTSLTVTVPAGATYAPITVTDTTTGLKAYSFNPFVVTFPSSHISDSTSFSSSSNFTTGVYPFKIAIGDIDGDDKPDVVVTNINDNTVSVFRNTSSTGSISASSFAGKVDFATGSSPQGLALADIDGDGKLDIVVSNYGSNTISILRNTSTSGSVTIGSFATKVDFATGTNPYGVAIGDLDEDGKPDIVVANGGNATVSVFHNTSSKGNITSASFAPKIDFIVGNLPWAVAVQDLDGDGKPEILAVNQNSNTLSILKNVTIADSITTGSFTLGGTLTTGTTPKGLAVGDLDGDGKPDVVVCSGSGTLSIYRNISTLGSITNSSFAASVDFTNIVNQYDVAINDIDGDGKPDIVSVGWDGFNGRILSFHNKSISGNITSNSFAAANISTGSAISALTIGDLDSDARPDLAMVMGGLSILHNTILSGVPNTASALFDGNARIRVADAKPANPSAVPSAYKVDGTAITIEAWIFPLDVPTGNDVRYIITRPATTGFGVDPYQTFALMIFGNPVIEHQPRIGVSITDGIHPTGAGYEVFVEDPNPVQLGQWTHVAGTYDGTTVKLYINGTMVHQLPLSVTIDTGSTGLYIGGASGGSFKGLIDEVRLWNITRTQSDIQSTISTSLNGNEFGLVGYWPMDSVYTANGGLATLDKTQNHNDLFLQFDAKLLPFPEGSTVQIAPMSVSLSNNYAITGLLYSAKLLPAAWPPPTFSVTQKPMGMTASGDSLFWTPSNNQYLSFPVVVQTTNNAGSRIDTFSVYSEAVRTTQNQVQTDITHRGKFGAFGNYGKGIKYKGQNGLYTGDFSLVCRNNSKYAGGLYSTTNSFHPLEGFSDTLSKFLGFTAFKTSFDDAWEPSNRIGVKVVQVVHNSTNSGDDKYAIIEYKVINISGGVINDLFAQLSNDFDIGNVTNDWGGYDSLSQLSYAYEVGGATNANYYGFSLLNKTVSGAAIILNGQDPNFFRSTANLTNFVLPATTPADTRNQISTGPYSIVAGDTLTFTFAMLAGDNLNDIKMSAQRAKQLYMNGSTVSSTWKMQLIASIGSYQDIQNYAGVDSTSSDGYDAGTDVPEPPPSPGNYISLYFPHPEWGSLLGNNFASDIRQSTSLADTIKRWYFQVKTNVVNDTVTLSFINNGIPLNMGKYLTDLTTGQRINLKNTTTFKYFHGTDTTARWFMIMIGDTTPPSIALNKPSTSTIWRSGTTRTIQWNASDRTGIDSIFIYSSSNGGSSYSLVASVGFTQSYNWRVPNEYLNNLYTVKIVVRDSLGNLSTVKNSQTFTVVGDSLANSNAAGWSLVSSPLTPYDSTVANIFGSSSYLWSYTQTTGYTQPSKIALGNGYWLGLTSGKNWSIKGIASEADSSVQNLQVGYNLIGNNYVRSVSKSNLYFLNSGSYYDFNSAVIAGLISNTLYGYSFSAYSSIDTMSLFGSYWIGVLQSGIQLIQKPSVSMIIPLAKHMQTFATNWDLPITVSTATMADNIAEIGIKSLTTSDFDPLYDAPRPPRNPGNKFLELYFTNTGGSYPPILGSKYAKDYRGSNNPQWSFTVESSDSGQTTLHWDNTVLTQLANSVHLTLIDQISSTSIDMSMQNSYTFTYSTARNFSITSIITGVTNNGEAVPVNFVLGQNYPNPFNPSTTIQYGLPERSTVRLVIYNLLGQTVMELINTEQEAGYKSIVWNANVASGMYFYRIEAISVNDPTRRFVNTKKMLLLK